MLAHWEVLIAAVAVAAAFWRQAWALGAWVRGWVLVSHRTDYRTGVALIGYLDATMRRRALSDPTYSSVRTFVRPLDRIYRVVFQVLGGGSQVFWKGLRPLWFFPETSSKNEAPSSNRHEFVMRFSYLRGSYDFDRLLIDAAAWEDNVRQGYGRRTVRFSVHHHYGTSFSDEMLRGRNDEARGAIAGWKQQDPESAFSTSDVRLLQWALDDIGAAVVSTLDNLSLRPELSWLAEEIKHWLASQQWHLRRGIPWRLGCLLHGLPGTGKTSFARAIAEELDLPVHVFDLSSMSNQDLKRAWREMLTSVPCMALLEDLDTVFNGRKNVSLQQAMGGGGMTFDCLLNCIDGIERVDGVLLVVTTNHREMLDNALIDRPGRVDVSVEFKPLDKDGRMKMAMRILEDAALAASVVEDGAEDSAARFQRRCCDLALAQRFGRARPSDEVAS